MLREQAISPQVLDFERLRPMGPSVSSWLPSLHSSFGSPCLLGTREKVVAGTWNLQKSKPKFWYDRCRPPPALVGGCCMQSMSLFTNHKSPYCDRSGDINWRFPFFQGLILNSENDTVIMKTKKTESTNKSWWPSSWRWRWPVVVVVHHAGADRRGGGFIANEDKQNVKHPKHKDLETAKHVGEADNKLNDLVLLDIKLLANPSHINRRPQSLHFDLADFLDLSEGKLEQELLAGFVHVLFDALWHWMCPWFLDPPETLCSLVFLRCCELFIDVLIWFLVGWL